MASLTDEEVDGSASLPPVTEEEVEKNMSSTSNLKKLAAR